MAFPTENFNFDQTLSRTMLASKGRELSSMSELTKAILKSDYNSDPRLWQKAMYRAFVCKNLELFGEGVFSILNDLKNLDLQNSISKECEALYDTLKPRLQTEYETACLRMEQFALSNRNNSNTSMKFLNESVLNSSANIIELFKKFLLSLKTLQSFVPSSKIVEELKNVNGEIKSIFFMWKMASYFTDDNNQAGEENTIVCDSPNNISFDRKLSVKSFPSVSDRNLISSCTSPKKNPDEKKYFYFNKLDPSIATSFDLEVNKTGKSNSDIDLKVNKDKDEPKALSKKLNTCNKIDDSNKDALSSKFPNIMQSKHSSEVKENLEAIAGSHASYIKLNPSDKLILCTLCNAKLPEFNAIKGHVNGKAHMNKHKQNATASKKPENLKGSGIDQNKIFQNLKESGIDQNKISQKKERKRQKNTDLSKKIKELETYTEILTTKYCKFCSCEIKDNNIAKQHIADVTHINNLEKIPTKSETKMTTGSKKKPVKIVTEDEIATVLGNHKIFFEIRDKDVYCILCASNLGGFSKPSLEAHANGSNHVKKVRSLDLGGSAKKNVKKNQKPSEDKMKMNNIDQNQGNSQDTVNAAAGDGNLRKTPKFKPEILSNLLKEHSVYITSNYDDTFFCWLCNSIVVGLDDIVKHTRGELHLKNYEQQL